MMVLSVCLVGGIVAYFVLGIKFLIEDWRAFEECSSSDLAFYVIVSLTLSVFRVCSSSGGQENSDIFFLICMFYCLASLELGMFTWGIVEIYEKAENCEKLQQSNLWNFAAFTTVLQGVALVIFCSLPLVMCMGLRSPPQETQLSDVTV
jgi:hypothetical protein